MTGSGQRNTPPDERRIMRILPAGVIAWTTLILAGILALFESTRPGAHYFLVAGILMVCWAADDAAGRRNGYSSH